MNRRKLKIPNGRLYLDMKKKAKYSENECEIKCPFLTTYPHYRCKATDEKLDFWETYSEDNIDVVQRTETCKTLGN